MTPLTHSESISDSILRTKLSSIRPFLLCQDLRWVVNLQKIRPESQAGLYLCRVPVLFCSRSGQIHRREVASPGLKINSLFARPNCSVSHFMSPIGLLSTTEKQIPSGCLHSHIMALKNSWHIPESLEKLIHIPKFLHPHLLWPLKEENAPSCCLGLY